MEALLKALAQPEYLHTLLNPIPVYGLLIAELALIAALVTRNRTALVIALALVFLTALSAWPVAELGERAYDRVLSMSDAAGQDWLEAHNWRADRVVIAYYVLAGLALLAAVLPWKWPRSRLPLASVTAGLALVALGFGGWTAYAGGRIRHREFRLEPPPSEQTERNRHA